MRSVGCLVTQRIIRPPPDQNNMCGPCNMLRQAGAFHLGRQQRCGAAAAQPPTHGLNTHEPRYTLIEVALTHSIRRHPSTHCSAPVTRAFPAMQASMAGRGLRGPGLAQRRGAAYRAGGKATASRLAPSDQWRACKPSPERRVAPIPARHGQCNKPLCCAAMLTTRRAVSRGSRGSMQCVASAAGAAAAMGGTPVPKNSILVVGGTGTLGRQVVRKALDEGYDVRCIVRPRMNPADFLRDWGATTVQVRPAQRSPCAPCWELCSPGSSGPSGGCTVQGLPLGTCLPGRRPTHPGSAMRQRCPSSPAWASMQHPITGPQPPPPLPPACAARPTSRTWSRFPQRWWA